MADVEVEYFHDEAKTQGPFRVPFKTKEEAEAFAVGVGGKLVTEKKAAPKAPAKPKAKPVAKSVETPPKVVAENNPHKGEAL